MFAYCNNNPVMYTDSLGVAPEWWQWTISGAMVLGGAALVATGIGGAAGGALICAGINSVIGSYVSEASGGSSLAGWSGGMVTGAIAGLGAGTAGAILVNATQMTGFSALGTATASCGVAISSGASGAVLGTITTAKIDNKTTNKKDIVNAAVVGGTMNLTASLFSGMGSGIASMPTYSTTSRVVANSLTTGWSIVTEVVNDIISTIAGWFK